MRYAKKDYWDEVDEMIQKEKDNFYDGFPEDEVPGWYRRMKKRRSERNQDSS